MTTVRGWFDTGLGRQGFSGSRSDFVKLGCCAVPHIQRVDKREAYENLKLSGDASGGLWKPAILQFQYLGRS
jgi:hypothetical protein